jgi:hypothetical protein
MAIWTVLSVRDRAIDTFGLPIFVVAAGAGLRSFIDECVRAGSTFALHPEDYDLYRLGTFNDQNGMFTSEPPEMIMSGKTAAQTTRTE